MAKSSRIRNPEDMQEEERLIERGSAEFELSNPLMDSPSMDGEADLKYFKPLLLATEVLGVLCIGLVSTWCGQYLGGFSWQEDPKHQFNHHPFFMVLGFIFCYGNALLVYRVFRHRRKRSLKLLHTGLNGAAFVFAVVALKAVFDSHDLNSPPIPNLYSLHSWIGLSTVILFSLQYVFGFVAFLFPGVSKARRSDYMPLHVFFGLSIFVLAIASAFSGITEKLMFTLGSEYNKFPPAAVVGNLLGYSLLIFGFLVTYLVATPQYRRRLLPEEVQLQLQLDPHNN